MILSIVLLLCACSGAQTSLTVKVADLNGIPLPHATVIVAENGAIAITDEHGSSGPISVPVDSSVDSITLFVRADGYTDCVLYNCTVYADRHRDGPIIRLLTYDGSLDFVVLTECPPDNLTQELIDKLIALPFPN